jgi:ribonuclease HII
MLEMDTLYQGYGFASHKGYPTPEHCRALKELGAVPIHRRSFGRVREALGLDPVQTELFADQSNDVATEAAAAHAQ